MRSIWLVFKHAVGMTLGQRSFWVMTFLVPVLLVGLNAYTVIQREDIGSNRNQPAAGHENQAGEIAGPSLFGLVDGAGLITAIPPDFPAHRFVRYPDRQAALTALEVGEISQVVYIHPDYFTSGAVTIYDRNFQILAGGDSTGLNFRSEDKWMLPYLLNYNLSGDESLTRALRNPTPGSLARYHAIRPQEQRNAGSQTMGVVVASMTPYIFYFLLLMGGSYLMRSVTTEKENRVAEVLLLSLQPRQLMVGKILAMCFVTLLEVVIWVGGGYLVVNRTASLLDLAAFQFPPGFLVWASLFLLFGFLLYAAIMAAAGAIAPNAKEAGQITWILVLPLIPTLIFASAFYENPHGTLALVLSFFPFSAPSAMVTRLAIAKVPLWQPVVSLAGVMLTAYVFVLLSARFFKSGNLLSSNPFEWRRLLYGWRE